MKNFDLYLEVFQCKEVRLSPIHESNRIKNFIILREIMNAYLFKGSVTKKIECFDLKISRLVLQKISPKKLLDIFF